MTNDASEQSSRPGSPAAGAARSRACNWAERERELLTRHQLTLLRSVRDKLVVAAQHKFDAVRHTLDDTPAVADVALRQADSVLVALRHAVHLVEHEQTHQVSTSDRAGG